MRLILNLLAFFALLMAPLAAPAAAMAAVPVKVECAGLGAADHAVPTGEHGQGEACCIAVPPGIDPPLASLAAFLTIGHLAFVAGIEPFRLGAGPKAEDPPPRRA